MKKNIILASLLLFLTGCTVNYNLEIEDNNFYEQITGEVLNTDFIISEEDIDIHSYLLYTDQPVFKNNDYIIYNKSLDNIEDRINYNFNYNYTSNNFINSRLLNSCFDNFNFKVNDNIYYISASGEFKCAYSDTTNINITTSHKVISHNASKKKSNTYTWTIDKDNTENLNIYITIDTSKEKKLIDLNFSIFKIISLIILLLLSGICIYLLKKKSN